MKNEQLTKYTNSCDPEECDTMIEVTCDNYGFPNGVMQITCPCGRKLDVLSVVDATITPSTQTICQNTPPTPIVVTASAGIPSGVYTYQWYSNVAPNTIGGIPLVPAVTTSTFIPPTSTVQTNYYYCIIYYIK